MTGVVYRNNRRKLIRSFSKQNKRRISFSPAQVADISLTQPDYSSIEQVLPDMLPLNQSSRNV
jgi:hypothetical protein